MLKNIGFVNASFEANEGSFLVHTGAGTVQNVYVQYNKISGASPDGYSGTLYNANLKVNRLVVDVTSTQISGNGNKFLLMTDNREADLKNFICLFGDNYSLQDVESGKVTIESNQDFTNDDYRKSFAKKVFFGSDELKNSEVFAGMSDWDGNLWHIDVDEGKIGFGVKTYVEPEFRQETITVPEDDRVRVELDINNDGTLNSGKVIDINIADIIGANEYTLVSVCGTGASSNNITAAMFGYAYGKQTVQIVVQAEYTLYTIDMPVLLVSKVIRTADDYAAWGKIAIACENDGKTEGSHNYGGYFELGNNITSTSGSIAMVYADENAWDKAGGFSGTFDGCGYAIDGLTATGNAFISCMTKDGVLRNIAFTNAKIAGASNFLCSGGLGTIENVYVQYVSIAAGSNNNGTIFNNCRDEKNVVGVIKNVFVDASNAVISGNGSLFRLIGGNNNGYNGIFAVCPEGYTVTQARDTGSFANAEHAVCAFASFDELKNKDETQNTLKGWDSTYWTIVDGVPAFVKK